MMSGKYQRKELNWAYPVCPKQMSCIHTGVDDMGDSGDLLFVSAESKQWRTNAICGPLLLNKILHEWQHLTDLWAMSQQGIPHLKKGGQLHGFLLIQRTGIKVSEQGMDVTDWSCLLPFLLAWNLPSKNSFLQSFQTRNHLAGFFKSHLFIQCSFAKCGGLGPQSPGSKEGNCSDFLGKTVKESIQLPHFQKNLGSMTRTLTDYD